MAAHLYVFSDASPTDWLHDGHDEDWHTIVNFVFQSDPALLPAIEKGKSHEEVLPQDPLYRHFIDSLESQLSSKTLRKWNSGISYQKQFCNSFGKSLRDSKPMISACSFQEKTLRNSKNALLASYNRHLGGVEGRGIGFDEFIDHKGRRNLRHSFLHWRTGCHEIKGLEDQLLVLLLMSWFIADQFKFNFCQIVKSDAFGFDQLRMSVVSDKLSGDDDSRLNSEKNLRNLIDPENDAAPFLLTRSKVSDQFSGDLLADNLAGWLTKAMITPNGPFATQANDLVSTGIWAGWHHLQLSASELVCLPAINRLS